MKRLICIFISLILFSSCKSIPSSVTSGKYGTLSNKVCCWGMRKTNDGPEFTKEQITLMDNYNSIYMGNKKEKTLYLTFDEGYENGYTSIILDVLKKKDVPATFFVTSAYIKNSPDLVNRMAKEGHIIGNHTANHPCVPNLTDAEIAKELEDLDRLVYGITKKPCKYFRAPKGEYSERSLAITNELGYINTFWSFAYVDWDNKASTDVAKAKILNGLHNGCVLLLHATAKANADCLESVIDTARKEGYNFKSLDEYKR